MVLFTVNAYTIWMNESEGMNQFNVIIYKSVMMIFFFVFFLLSLGEIEQNSPSLLTEIGQQVGRVGQGV